MQVTIRDLTVRAADHPDMAALLFFFFSFSPGGGGQGINRPCLSEKGNAARV